MSLRCCGGHSCSWRLRGPIHLAVMEALRGLITERGLTLEQRPHLSSLPLVSWWRRRPTRSRRPRWSRWRPRWSGWRPWWSRRSRRPHARWRGSHARVGGSAHSVGGHGGASHPRGHVATCGYKVTLLVHHGEYMLWIQSLYQSIMESTCCGYKVTLLWIQSHFISPSWRVPAVDTKSFYQSIMEITCCGYKVTLSVHHGDYLLWIQSHCISPSWRVHAVDTKSLY